MKNPFLSLWLSAANRIGATMRGQMLAETRKAQKKALAEMTKPARAARKRRKKA